MNRIVRTTLVLVLSALVVLSFASCQSGAATEETVEIVAVQADENVADVPPVPAPAEEPAAEAVSAEAPAEAAPAEAAEVPVEMAVEYRGYSLSITSYDGYATVEYPAGVVTDDDIAAFMAAESMKYGDSVSGVSYSVSGNTLTLNYPEGVSAADRRALSAAFITDVIDTVNAIYPSDSSDPVKVTHSYDGYSLSITIENGKALLEYPDFLTSAEVSGFFGAVNLEYGDTLGSVFYTIDGPGTVSLSYPESVGFAEANGFAAILVTTLISYAGL